MLAALAAGLVTGADLDLDLDAIMHWGADVALERHYVPRRSQRTRSGLSFFAQDAGTHTLVYANADLTKATQHAEVIAFAEHWQAAAGSWPAQLVFDSRLTTQRQLDGRDNPNAAAAALTVARSHSTLRTISYLTWTTSRASKNGADTNPSSRTRSGCTFRLRDSLSARSFGSSSRFAITPPAAGWQQEYARTRR